ncbi:MAG TPA: hypothetical protein VFX92_01850 [Candidatus Krumholzibacteria bacterium]|nr:hypothetical protein [Candidatus Krumholzibacteria bacterium]
MFKRMMVATLAVLVTASAIPVFAADVMFAYGFAPGSSERYGVKMNQETDFGSGAMGQIADFEVTVKCISVADGKAAVTMTFDKVDISREMFGNIAPDASGEAIVGKTIACTVDASGEVTDIKPSPYFDGWEQVQNMLEPIVEGWYLNMPGKTVAPGGTWDSTRKDTGMGGMDVTSTGTFTFKEMKKEAGRECALVIADIATTLSGHMTNQMGDFEVAGNGKGKFDVYFDPASGTVIKLKGKTEVEANLSPSTGGDNAVTVNTTYQIERTLL